MADLTPRTETGKRLLEHVEAMNARSFALVTSGDILAIEAEAAEAALTASRERERRLREALKDIADGQTLLTSTWDGWRTVTLLRDLARAALLDTESPAP